MVVTGLIDDSNLWGPRFEIASGGGSVTVRGRSKGADVDRVFVALGACEPVDVAYQQRGTRR